MDSLADQIDYVALDQLRLDPRNPRLTEAEQAAVSDQSDLLRVIDKEYDPLTIAESIAEHGYFPSEPMIVLEEGGELIVLEGNRRLCALKGLADPELSATFKNPARWAELHEESKIPDQIPVIKAGSRIGVAPLIGYRHISGIEPWKPLQKARFIADLVDNHEKLSFDDVYEQVGEPRNTVAALYRNRAMLQQARSWGLDTARAESAFGVFTAALNRRALREFVHAPPAPQVNERDLPLADSDETRERMGEFLAWVFGENRVLKDSRKLKELAFVADSESALSVLRDTGNLLEAYAAAGGPEQASVKRLRSAATGIRETLNEFTESPELLASEDVIEAGTECVDLAAQLDQSLPKTSDQ
jgi:hypothetical protein